MKVGVFSKPVKVDFTQGVADTVAVETKAEGMKKKQTRSSTQRDFEGGNGQTELVLKRMEAVTSDRMERKDRPEKGERRVRREEADEAIQLVGALAF